MMPDSFEIWQLKHTDLGIRLRFMSSDFLARHDYTVDLNNYDRVYSGELKPGTSLEDLYTQFNLYHPEGFRGHSMSVSDLVILNQGGETTAFYCDRIGFTDVSDLVLEDYEKIRPSIRQRLKQALAKQKEQSAQELSKAKVKENSL